MIQQASLDQYKTRLAGHVPVAHVVLGSGFGTALSSLKASEWSLLKEFSFAEIPGLSASTVADHAGAFRHYLHVASKKSVIFQMGRIHGYEGHSPQKVVLPVLLSRLAGTSKFILTNAAGGLDPQMKPGEVMIITDQVNLTGQSPLTGPNPKDPQGNELGPRFPDMGHAYDPELRAKLKTLLNKKSLTHHEGIYLGLNGPAFETFAEVRLFAQWGMKAVGMSTVWETLALRHTKAQVVGLSMISNLAAGLSNQGLEHEAIVETCRSSAAKIIEVVSDLLATEILK